MKSTNSIVATVAAFVLIIAIAVALLAGCGSDTESYDNDYTGYPSDTVVEEGDFYEELDESIIGDLEDRLTLIAPEGEIHRCIYDQQNDEFISCL